jgi:predicted ATPase
MPDSSQNIFRNKELDPHLLSTPFKVQTNWHVITGASSSGKTTIIDQLADNGFQTFQEVGRQFFEKELAKGRTIDEIREDRAVLTRQVYELWLELNRGLQPSEPIFLDRGLPDALAFYRFAGMDPNDILPDCFQFRYASVFMLNRLPYQQDGVRGGDDASAAYFESWMLRDYSSLGYEVIRVPVLSPEERLSFILERLSESKLRGGVGNNG